MVASSITTQSLGSDLNLMHGKPVPSGASYKRPRREVTSFLNPLLMFSLLPSCASPPSSGRAYSVDSWFTNSQPFVIKCSAPQTLLHTTALVPQSILPHGKRTAILPVSECNTRILQVAKRYQYRYQAFQACYSRVCQGECHSS